MENTSNEQSGSGDKTVNEQTTCAQAEPQPQPERRILDVLGDAIRSGAEDARTAAEKTIPKVKSAATSALYWTAYGASYAAVFQWTFAKGILPESLNAGCRDGVKAAKEAAGRWADKLKERKATVTSPEQTGPSTEAVQSGAA